MRAGKIIEPVGINIWDHERHTAKALARAGLTVEFLPVHGNTNSPDVLIDGELWEIKSPKTGRLQQIEYNLIKASRQSENIIIDAQRIKDLPDRKVEQFLAAKLHERKSVRKILYINKHREVIDIS